MQDMVVVQTMPRGVQLHLGSAQQPHLQDTLVMSNLGYFQLKAAPGAWNLQLAPGKQDPLLLSTCSLFSSRDVHAAYAGNAVILVVTSLTASWRQLTS